MEMGLGDGRARDDDDGSNVPRVPVDYVQFLARRCSSYTGWLGGLLVTRGGHLSSANGSWDEESFVFRGIWCSSMCEEFVVVMVIEMS